MAVLSHALNSLHTYVHPHQSFASPLWSCQALRQCPPLCPPSTMRDRCSTGGRKRDRVIRHTSCTGPRQGPPLPGPRALKMLEIRNIEVTTLCN